MKKTSRRWRRRRGRWRGAKLMDSVSEAADEEPAAASVSADSTQKLGGRRKRRVVTEPRRIKRVSVK